MKKYIRNTSKMQGRPIVSASQQKGYADAKYFATKYAKAMKVLATN